MKIVKPLRLSLMSRPYRLHRRQRLGLGVFALASLDPQPILQPEADMWQLVGQVLDDDGILDLGIPKPCAEFLVSGSAYPAPSQRPGTCAVQVRVGDLRKSLTVFGDRYWLDGRATEPQPYEIMPLDWVHAYGGPSCADNPHGRGADDEVLNGVRTRRLPNIEPMQDRMVRPGQQPEPAGFGPVSPMWPRRFRRAGEYSPDWLEDGSRGLPDSLDPHFFNAAPPDQWWPARAELAPGTDYEIWHMHPDRACLEGTLPDWRARCFVQREGDDALEEVPMSLSTAWFFPDREQVLLMYHGATDVVEDDGADLVLAMPALETDGQRRPQAYYETVLARRQDPDEGPLYALQDKDLLPQAALGPWHALDTQGPMQRPFAVNQRARGEAARARMREELRVAGLDPTPFEVPESPLPRQPTLDDLPDVMRHARQAAQEARIDMLHAKRKMAEDMRKEAGNMPPGMTPESLFESADAGVAGGPPTLRGQPGMDMLQDLARTRPVGEGEEALDADSLPSMMKESDARLRGMYLHGAHLQPPAEVARPARAARMRRRVQALMAGSRDLSGLDLTGADLSDLDLRGARCVGTWFECADLSGTRLDQADLSRAVLTRVRADGGSWRAVELAGANLGRAQLIDIDLSGARLSNTQLDGIELDRCNFSEAKVSDCNLTDAMLQDCRFDAAQLDTVTFLQQTRLAGTTFTGARLARVVWLDCVLDAVAYERAHLTRCAWVQSQCERPADWARAELTMCCAVETDLDGAVFTAAVLRECNLRDTVLAGADFAAATLQRCDFSQADLGGANLAGARADESLFIRTSFAGATLIDADLKGALLHKADLAPADLRGANLFRADLAQARLDDTTDTRGAYVHLANTRAVLATS